MWNPGFGWGIGHGLFSLFGNIIAGLAFILCVSVTIAVLFLLVRFLLIATRAAQLYVDSNEPKARTTPPTPAPAGDSGSDPEQTVPTDMESAATAASRTLAPDSTIASPKSAANAASAKRASNAKPTPKSPPAS